MTEDYTEFAVTESAQTMTHDIGHLALALSKAQGKITGALKDSTNPFFKSNYADLGNVLAACREPLSENELAVVQTNESHPTDVIVITTLIHSSGQWIRGTIRMKPTKPDPQGHGSTLTYCRRYAYAAIIGVAQVDDDGNKGSEPKPVKKVTPDKEAVSMLKSADDMDTLASVWKDLTHDQRTSIGKDGLDAFKANLQ